MKGYEVTMIICNKIIACAKEISTVMILKTALSLHESKSKI